MLHKTEMESHLMSYFRTGMEFTPPPPNCEIELNYTLQYYTPAHSAFGALVFALASMGRAGVSLLCLCVFYTPNNLQSHDNCN